MKLIVYSEVRPGDGGKTGLVLAQVSGFYDVREESGAVVVCRRRGKLKMDILAGDQVAFTPLETGRGVIEARLPRTNELYRPRVANISLAFLVMAVNEPAQIGRAHV
jgi:ribosome biogenesis GTPase